MEADEEAGYDFDFESGTRSAPSLVSLTPFSVSSTPSRRLSSSLTELPRQVACSSAKRLAWVSLQGRMVNAEEASSARAIGGGLCREQALAWELFTPFQRFLIVAVIGVAAAESKKNRVIEHLKKSVDLRDHVLSSMQQKLDTLCEQLSNVKDQADSRNKKSFDKIAELPWNEPFGSDKVQFVDCGCWLCDQHRNLFCGLMGNSAMKGSAGEEMLHYKMNLRNDAEPEERRMSDLSDWASSVTSSAEIQMNSFVTEQDICSLKKESEEKDAAINELTTLLHSSNVAGSKRIAELEDIIRRKNSAITRLKKDMMVLEQKLVQFTRLCRRSTSASTCSSDCWQSPVMTDNLLYDMDSTTSPSSSDSDSAPDKKSQVSAPKPENLLVQIGDFASTRNQKPPPPKSSSLMVRPTNQHITSRPGSPLKEITANQKFNTPSRQKQLSASGDYKRSRRRIQPAYKDAAPQKRWV